MINKLENLYNYYLIRLFSNQKIIIIIILFIPFKKKKRLYFSDYLIRH